MLSSVASGCWKTVCTRGSTPALLCGRSASPLDVTMRTFLFFLVGFLLLAACLILGRLFSAHYPSATYAATVAFISLWLVISAFNLWVGVSKAGYTLGDELPIFLLIFAVPAAVAITLKWRFL